jgi:hypothetical protein
MNTVINRWSMHTPILMMSIIGMLMAEATRQENRTHTGITIKLCATATRMYRTCITPIGIEARGKT